MKITTYSAVENPYHGGRPLHAHRVTEAMDRRQDGICLAIGR